MNIQTSSYQENNIFWNRVTQLMSSLNTLDVASPLKNTLLLNLLRGVVVYWLFPHLEIHDRSQYILRGGLGLGPRLKSKGLQYNYTPTPVQFNVLDQGSNEKDCVTLAFV